MKTFVQIMMSFFTVITLICCQANNDKKVSDTNRISDSLKGVHSTNYNDSVRISDSLSRAISGNNNDSRVRPYGDSMNSIFMYQDRVFAFCLIRFKYKKELGGYYEIRKVLKESAHRDPKFEDEKVYIQPRDTTIFETVISEIHEIDNSPDSKYRLLDQFEKEYRQSRSDAMPSSIILLSRYPYAYNSYAEASFARVKHMQQTN